MLGIKRVASLFACACFLSLAAGCAAGGTSTDTSGPGVQPGDDASAEGAAGSGGGGSGGSSGTGGSTATGGTGGSDIDAGTGGSVGDDAGAGGDQDASLDAPDDTQTDTAADTSDEESGPVGCAPGTVDLNGPGDGSDIDGCEYACTFVSATDAFDSDFKDDNCDGSDGPVEQCVYVSASKGTDSATCGSRAEPCKTINAAIGIAKLGVEKRPVCVSGETFDEKVNVESGVSVYGGFDQNDTTFPFRRKAGFRPTIKSAGVTIEAALIEEDTHLEELRIETASPPSSQTGASAIGVYLHGGNGRLWVRYNSITVYDGTSGAAGTGAVPMTPIQASNGIKGGDGCEASAGLTGCSGTCAGGGGGTAPSCGFPGGKGGDGGFGNAQGQDGSPSPLPAGNGALGGTTTSSNDCDTFQNAGTIVASQFGKSGSNGTTGASPIGGASMGSVHAGEYTPGNGGGGNGGTNGFGGGGGAGGGGGKGGLTTGCSTCDQGGGGGSGGCGGLGGNAGDGGQGGGASFGIFIGGGNATIDANDIQTGSGGKGGRGGDGGSGQAGGTGGPGGAVADDADGGGNGGDGGDGGDGSPGGGGGGGPTACVAHAGTANVSVTHKICLTGSGGDPGTGGLYPNGTPGTPGAAGSEAQTLPLPVL